MKKTDPVIREIIAELAATLFVPVMTLCYREFIKIWTAAFKEDRNE